MSNHGDEKTLFKRGGQSMNDDWDDTALIEAYDKALLRVKQHIAEKNNQLGDTAAAKDKNFKKKKMGKKWKVGDFCRALYTEDGLLYEAKIMEINNAEGYCVVQFIGYGNKEEVDLQDLKLTQGKSFRSKQEDLAKTISTQVNGNIESEVSSVMSDDQSSSDVIGKSYAHHFDHHHSKGVSASYDCASSASESMCNPVSLPKSAMPAPPMPFPLQGDVNDDEALASMLMSWYMAGYHTGFYQGRQSNQGAGDSRKLKHHCCHNTY